MLPHMLISIEHREILDTMQRCYIIEEVQRPAVAGTRRAADGGIARRFRIRLPHR